MCFPQAGVMKPHACASDVHVRLKNLASFSQTGKQEAQKGAISAHVKRNIKMGKEKMV
jgi:hypothetical protein